MSLHKTYETDSSLETSGVELDYGPNEDLDGQPNIIIRIARAGGANTRFSQVMEQLSKPFRRQLKMGTARDEQLMPVLRRAYARAVVLGWKNVTTKEGDLLEFTENNCVKLFEQLPELFEDIQSQAKEAALFRSALLESDAKNS